MYTLYDIFGSRREQILKSIGTEYLSLNEEDLNIILINLCKQIAILDNDSAVITNNPKFWLLMSKTPDELSKLDKYDSNMYKLDLILLELNTKESKNLIVKFGSNYANTIINPQILPLEIMRSIILNTTDRNTLISYHSSNRAYRELINNNLRTIAKNVMNKEFAMSYKYNIDQDLDKIKNFNDFIEWYNQHFYTVPDTCKDINLPSCYSAALNKGEVDNVTIILERIENYLKKYPHYMYYYNVPIKDIIYLGERFKFDVSDELIRYCQDDHTDSEIEMLKQYYSKFDKDDFKHLLESMSVDMVTVSCPIIFKILADFGKFTEDEMKRIFEHIVGLNTPANPDKLYESAKLTVGEDYASEITLNYLRKFLGNMLSGKFSKDEDGQNRQLIILKELLTYIESIPLDKIAVNNILLSLRYLRDKARQYVLEYTSQ